MDDDCDDVPIVNDYYTPVGLNEVKKEFPAVKVEDLDKHGPLPYPEDLNEFFGRPQAQLFLLQVNVVCASGSYEMELSSFNSRFLSSLYQLPDSLPGEGPDEEPADSADLERSSSPDPVRILFLCNFDETKIFNFYSSSNFPVVSILYREAAERRSHRKNS